MNSAADVNLFFGFFSFSLLRLFFWAALGR